MATSRLLEIDVRQVADLADSLGRLGADSFGRAAVTAVNEVARRSEPKIRDDIGRGINLAEAYVRERLGLRLADSPARPEAAIVARNSDTPLGRYEPRQLTKAAKHPDRAKGDPSRGIRPGQRAAGVTVEVSRGARKPITNGFTMPLKNGNGMGVFTRSGGSLRYRHRYGPSVYQLAGVAFSSLGDEIITDLELTTLDEAVRVVNGALS